MTSEDLSDVTKSLERAKVDDTGELSFKGKGLKLDKKENAKEIIDAIEQCSNMTALRMEGNTLGVEAAEAIAEALKKHPEFQRARWSDMFTGRLKSEIPPALKHLGRAMTEAGARLVELDLSDNAFGPNGVEGIVDLLKSPTCYTLRELRLNNNGLGTTGGKGIVGLLKSPTCYTLRELRLNNNGLGTTGEKVMLAAALMACYKSSAAAGTPLALQVFVSGRGRLENEGSIELAEVFKLMGSLVELSMPQNGINHEGVTALSGALAHNPGLRVLNLSDNTFTEIGAKAMAKVLPKLQNLEVINFGDCLVRTAGVKVIATAITDGHHKLRELNLSGNEIGKAGATKVAECVENKENLEVLDLNANQLGEEGVELLRASMEAIEKLDILNTLSDDEGTDDEEEDGEYDESYQDEDAQEDEEGEKLDDPELQVHGKALSPNKNVKDFLSFPSPTKLQNIGKELSLSVRTELGANISDPEQVVQTLVRMSTVVSEEDKKSQQNVCQCADDILTDLLKSDPDSNGPLVANAFLVYLGLLKGEDKKYRPPSDITGPLIVLHHIVRQSYFPRSARTLISAFMDKPHPLLLKSTDIRNKLLQTLYSS